MTVAFDDFNHTLEIRTLTNETFRYHDVYWLQTIGPARQNAFGFYDVVAVHWKGYPKLVTLMF